ncbi:hypothetical protein GTGU_02085 [Trabulsiella guamensis ATCC 49490]|uniref:HNH/Endo VII superfamily nuclease toxins domain-containing protein n=2 Tax=Trabulsiella guamensis TaxID=158852 RepID=A0A085AAB8_9ENTR|nr:hypothetical protein GTGU_02085 [Trabulsiella guamensis ATCC 49490]
MYGQLLFNSEKKRVWAKSYHGGYVAGKTAVTNGKHGEKSTSPLQSASERVVSDNNALAIVVAGNSAAAAGSGAVAGAVGQGSQYQVNNTTDDLDMAGSCEGTREQCAVRDPSRDGTRGPGHTELPIAEQDPTGGKLVNPDQSSEQGLTHTGNNQPSGQSVTNTGNPGGNPDTGGNTTVTPIAEGPSKDELAYLDKPANLSPEGSARSGAFNEAKRQSGIPVSQSPSKVYPNVDKRNNPQPGYIYEFDVPRPGGGTQKVYIRDDAGGHFFTDDPSQNRGPHFNDEKGNHYDY